jgi:TPR repeat protein
MLAKQITAALFLVVVMACECEHARAQQNAPQKVIISRTEYESSPILEISALKDWIAKAEQGDPDAQNRVGEFYSWDESGHKNPAEAVKWYRKAAEQGHTCAVLHLAEIYSTGSCAPYMPQSQTDWYLKAGIASQPKDLAEGLKWYRQAGGQGRVQAQVFLACYYSNGMHKNSVEAYAWADLSGPDHHDLRDRVARFMARPQLEAAKKRVKELQEQIRDYREKNHIITIPSFSQPDTYIGPLRRR